MLATNFGFCFVLFLISLPQETASRELGQICYQDVHCEPTNSICRTSGFSSVRRCECRRGFVQVSSGDQQICGTRLYALDNPDCSTCIQNNGVCFTTSNMSEPGCHCPPARHGQLCENVTASVYCDNDTIQLCYTPRDMTERHAFVPGKGNLPHCSSYTADARHPRCKQGDIVVELLIGSSMERDVCDTGFQHTSANTVEYDNFVAITRRKTVINTKTDKIIKVSCLFETHTTALVGTMHFENGGNIGKINKHERPDLRFYLTDSFGHHFDPDYTVLRPGDLIKMRVHLNTTGAYEGIEVQECIASASPSLHHTTSYLRFIDDGCPSTNQTVFDYEHIFFRVNGDPGDLSTTAFKAFQLSSGKSVFIHCRVKICTNADNCPVHNCGGQQHNRFRRNAVTNKILESVRSETVNILVGYKFEHLQRLPLHQDNKFSWSTYFWCITAGTSLMFFVLIAFVCSSLKNHNSHLYKTCF